MIMKTITPYFTPICINATGRKKLNFLNIGDLPFSTNIGAVAARVRLTCNGCIGQKNTS
jgi:hypothetical protein